MDKEWSVPWPDGSWLTWNEETESWERQEGGPSPEEAGEATAPSEPERAGKPPAAKKPAGATKPAGASKAASAAGARTPRRATPSKRAKETAGDVRPAASARATALSPGSDEAREGVGPSAWRPISERTQEEVLPGPRPVQVRSTMPSASRQRPWRNTRFHETSLLPALLAGCVVGVVAGAFLSYLIR